MDVDEILTLIKLDKKSDLALYAQLKDAILTAIRAETLPVGTRLPPVRRLAEFFDLNTMTAARAYKELAEIGAVVGKGALGTFVADFASLPIAGDAQGSREEYSTWDADTFGRMLQFSDRPGVIPFTRAYPDHHVIDTLPFEESLTRALAHRRDEVFSYVSPDGSEELRDGLGSLMLQERGVSLSADNMIITSGGQQAISLVTQTLLQRGDTVIVERPTYFGALDLFSTMGVQPLGVRLESDGPDLNEFEYLVKTQNPKLIFLIPTFHNPTGVTTSLSKRRAILQIARRHGIPILEDDCCAEMRYSGNAIPSLRSLAEPGDEIYYFSSLGKVYVPGLRLGLLDVPHLKHNDVVKRKSISDLHTSSILQGAMVEYLKTPKVVASNLKKLRETYGSLLDRLTKEMKRILPPDCSFEKPEGGLNIWLTLPEGIDSIEFFYAALQRNVSVLVGLHFYPDKPDTRTVRLSLGFSAEETALSAARGLSDAISDLTRRSFQRYPVLV